MITAIGVHTTNPSPGNLWINRWNGSTWTWQDQGRPPGINLLDISVGHFSVITMKDTPTSPERPYAFVFGSDGNLWVNWLQGVNWNWTNLGKPPGVNINRFMGALTVMDTPTSPQRPYVFVRCGDNNLWVNYWDGATWSWANQGKPPGLNVDYPVGATTMMNTPTSYQRPYIFVKCNDGSMWVNWWDGANWNWANQGKPGGMNFDLGMVITVMDTPTSMQRPYVFVHNMVDGNMWVNFWDGSAWQWVNNGRPQGLTIRHQAGAITVKDSPGSFQKPYVFVTCSDGHMWRNFWDGSAWLWVDHGQPAQGTRTGMGIITMMDTATSPQRPYVFTLSTNFTSGANLGLLYVNWMP